MILLTVGDFQVTLCSEGVNWVRVERLVLVLKVTIVTIEFKRKVYVCNVCARYNVCHCQVKLRMSR